MSWRDRISAVLAGKVGGPTPSGIHVYHSSPHDFDKFDLSKIGTGEGAQVYGHGIYAAENPAVSGQGGQYWQQFLSRAPREEMRAAELLKQHNFDRDAAIAEIQRQIEATRVRAQGSPGDFHRDNLDFLQRRLTTLESGAPVGPRTYEVNFKAKPEELLDWDKPLNQMSPEVQDRLHSAWIAHRDDHARMTGEGIYGTLEAKNWDSSKYRGAGKPAASQELLNAGIPGIRYLDEGSRNIPTAIRDIEGYIKQGGTHKGARADMWASRLDELKQQPLTYNYVAFDPSKLDIMAKYGVVGGAPIGAATMGSAFDPATYGASQ